MSERSPELTMGSSLPEDPLSPWCSWAHTRLCGHPLLKPGSWMPALLPSVLQPHVGGALGVRSLQEGGRVPASPEAPFKG